MISLKQVVGVSSLLLIGLIQSGLAQTSFSSSFSHLLSSQHADATRVLSQDHQLGTACLNFLKNKVYAQGETLTHPIFERISVPLSQYHLHYDAINNYFSDARQKKSRIIFWV